MLLGLTNLSRFLTYLTAFFGAFLAALWLSIIFWTLRDIRKRSEDRFVQILAVLTTAILNLPGLVIYLILRPSESLEEAYFRTLEEEALLSQIEERTLCPGCGSQVDAGWLICAHCHTRLRKSCHSCGKLLELPWQICPYCGNNAPSVSSESEIQAST
ncbi:MAG: zinc ribbon domain-containing protein [Anaerolineales bacterium]|jgi:formate dehydrogenase maturation protein FdhE